MLFSSIPSFDQKVFRSLSSRKNAHCLDSLITMSMSRKPNGCYVALQISQRHLQRQHQGSQTIITPPSFSLIYPALLPLLFNRYATSLRHASVTTKDIYFPSFRLSPASRSCSSNASSHPSPRHIRVVSILHLKIPVVIGDQLRSVAINSVQFCSTQLIIILSMMWRTMGEVFFLIDSQNTPITLKHPRQILDCQTDSRTSPSRYLD